MRFQILLIALLSGLIFWVGVYEAGKAVYWQWAHPYHGQFTPIP